MEISLIGIVIAILIFFPNIIFSKNFQNKNTNPDIIIDTWRLFPNITFIKRNAHTEIKNKPIIFSIIEILELIGQLNCFIFIIFSNDPLKLNNINPFMMLMILCILIYYGLWIRYIVNGQNFLFLWKSFLYIPIPLAIFPVCIFGFAALWKNSVMLGISTITFAICHFIITKNIYKDMIVNNKKR